MVFSVALRSLEGAALLEMLELYAAHGLAAEEPDQTYYLAADVARQVGRSDLALRYLEEGRERFGDNPVLCEKLGFSALDLGDTARAEAEFRKGTEIDPDFAPNWYGLCVSLNALGRQTEAAQAAGPVLAWEDRYDPVGFARLVAELAEAEYSRGARAEVVELYGFLHARGGDDLATVRYADILLKCGRPAEARRVIGRFDLTIPRPGKWETCILVEVLIGVGEIDEARDLAEFLLGGPDFHVHFLRTYLRTHPDIESVRESRGHVAARFAGADRKVMDLVRVSFVFAAREFDVAVSSYATIGPEARRELCYEALTMGYLMNERGLTRDAAAMADILAKDGHINFPVALLRINVAFAQQDYDLAGTYLKGLEPSNDRDAMELRLKKFELACFTGDFDAARDLEGLLLADAEFARNALPPVLRFRSELRDWSGVCDAFLQHGLAEFNFAQLGDVVFRAFTRAERTRELSDRIEEVDGWSRNTDIARLWVSLAEHDAASPADMAYLLTDAPVTLDPVVKRRLQTALRYLETPSVQTGTPDQAVFFCTNTSYRKGTAVALMSLIRSNLSRLSDTQVFVVTDEEDDLSSEIFPIMAKAANLRTEIVPVKSFLDDFSKLDPSYGIFTSGHELSQAAYYRIFFARQLAADKQWRRATYLDSDVAVVGNLHELLAGDFEGKALAARREVVRPEIIIATREHGMQPEQYFNSGILSFDMTHPETDGCLDRAIHSINEARLFFHDQCALNIGFHGHVKYLPISQNFFVPPMVSPSDVDGDAAVLHYLDRPKPWEPTYAAEVGLPWLDNLDNVVSMVGPELAARLFHE